ISKFRQTIMSSFEKGGSAVTSCLAKTHILRIALFIWYDPFTLAKKRFRRSGDKEGDAMYTPCRAFSSTVSLTSVAKIWICGWTRAWSRYSSRQIASEYTSSPVEQPGTHILIGSSADLFFRMLGNISFFNTSKVRGSRKNPVTLIRMSWNRELSSPGFV